MESKLIDLDLKSVGRKYVRDVGIWSPKDGMGKTTIAMLLGLEMSKKGLTAILDLNRYSSALPYIARNAGKKGLKGAYDSMEDEATLQQFVQWKDMPLFYLCMSVHEKLDDLYRFSSERISEIIKLAKSNFDHVIVIIPSNYIESGFIAGFESHPSRLLTVLDEEVSNWYRYKTYKDYFDDVGLQLPYEMVVINRWQGFLDTSGKLAGEMPEVQRMCKFPWVKGMTDLRNRGDLSPAKWFIGKEMRNARNGLDEIMEFVTMEVNYGSDAG